MMNTPSPLLHSMTMDMEMTMDRKGQEGRKESPGTQREVKAKMLATKVGLMKLKVRMTLVTTVALPLLKSCNPHRKPGK